MRTFAVAALAVIASADPSDFPKDAWNHAGCHMTVTYPNTNCESLWNAMNSEINAWNPEPLDTPGYYSVYEEVPDQYIWSNRLTYNQKYNDEQLFEFAPSGAGCQVVAKSRSDTVSMLDNCVNYCNMWNVFNGLEEAGVGSFTIDKVFSCSQTPSDPVTTCARY